MKVRRRFAVGTWWERTIGWVRRRVRRWRSVLSGRRPAPRGGSPPAGARRPNAESRFLILASGLAAAGLVVGYLLAALVFFPAPIFAASRGVPSVLALPVETATARIEEAGLIADVVDDRVSHPAIPSGAVVWQDPPAGVVVPEATEVQLTLSAGPQRIPVPDIAGYDAAIARSLLESAGLIVGSVEQTQAPTPQNVAVNTRPPAGATLLPGSRVTLVVSVGAPTIRVPDLVGLTLDSARTLLESRNLAMGENYHQRNLSVTPGRIFFQAPAAGTLIAPGTQVNVRLARGEPEP